MFNEVNMNQIPTKTNYFHYAETQTASFIKTYKVLLICWAALAGYIYFDNIKNYPNSIVERGQIRGIYSFFDYVDDEPRKEEALAYAKANGNQYKAEMLMLMGFRFLRPIINWWGLFCLLFMPILTSLFVFQLIDTKRKLLNRFFNKTQKTQHVDQEVKENV